MLHVLQNSQISDSLQIIKKNENIQFGQIYIYVFFKEDICFTFQFLEDQKLKQERSCEVLNKKNLFCPILPPMSDLTPFYGTGTQCFR